MHWLTSNPPTAIVCLLGASGQESGPFETIELTDAMSEPKATTAADNGEEMVTIAEGLEVVPSLLPNPELPHLKRALGWISLTSMGVGATIGAGIFVMSAQQTFQPSLCVGASAAMHSRSKQRAARPRAQASGFPCELALHCSLLHCHRTGIVAHDIAGPAISISFVVAAIACAFSGLCYVVNKSSWARCTADLVGSL